MSEADPAIRPEAVLTEEAAAEPVRRSRRWRLLLMLSLPLALLLVGGWFWLTSGRYVSTDNAYVQQDMVAVAAEVNGVVAERMKRPNPSAGARSTASRCALTASSMSRRRYSSSLACALAVE